MRLSCCYECDILPLSYRMMFVSLIKKSLEKSNKEYFNNLYYYKDKSNKKSKNFCFSVYLNDFSRENENFRVDGKIILNISSPDHEFMINLYNGLLKNVEFEYKGYRLKKERVRLIREKKILKDRAIFKTLSPIYIKDKVGNSLSPEDEKYEENLNYILDLTLKNFRGYGLKREVKFNSINLTKVVVKEKIRGYIEKNDNDYLYLNSYRGNFYIEGDVEDLNYIYMLGIGFRRNQGFGMVEVLE
ncbi:CRISPR-associated protein, Cas6 family [Caloranaerobacter azorensis DSM 13643]|uniref:CRISPR-associated protein, Cas6 family n=1 Tax=Caloranaerobacter azorensis DSM 13643 TaxID=1121264 RepID=A0A1M5W2K9_9FIRM|nr:CRISPR-associated endoribonuclease Cas6 [Caloranaerobacter azorensis]SHH81668.1 CRISPR-associated protein, Cas6 family [Caloranaerobacter azorensis DSM 13643]